MLDTPDPASLLARALAYPGPMPSGSFALGPGGPGVLDAAEAEARARRAAHDAVALVAYGANASPGVLFAKLGAGARLVALAAELSGWDVVYSAHLASYGSVPATLWPSAGTILRCHLLLLGTAELTALDSTEPNYQRRPLEGAGLMVGRESPPAWAWAYRSRHGALKVDGAPLALAAVPASGRRLAGADQASVLARVRDRVAPGSSLAELVGRAVGDPRLRAGWIAALRADALGAADDR